MTVRLLTTCAMDCLVLCVYGGGIFFFFFFWVFDWGFGSGHFWSGMVFWLCVFGLQGMVSVFGVALHVVIMACLASGGTERSSDDRIFELVKSDRCDIK